MTLLAPATITDVASQCIPGTRLSGGRYLYGCTAVMVATRGAVPAAYEDKDSVLVWTC